jgi:predicted Zn-dependent protease
MRDVVPEEAHRERAGGRSVETPPVAWRVRMEPDFLAEAAFDPNRGQLNADTLLATLARRYPVSGAQTVIVGLTDFDMFRGLEPDLRFVFSTRARSGYAVVSAARMGQGLLERVLRRDRKEERVRKMVERNVGVLFYKLQLRPDSSSLLRDEIGGVDDIDEMRGGLSFASP